MEIVPFRSARLPEAAALFVEHFRALRRQIDVLPDAMEDIDQVVAKLASIADSGWMAVERGKLIGYLGGFVIDGFRDTERRGAYCPEWGHAAGEASIYRALYRAAAERWAAMGCGVHAISLLAHDRTAENVWFWLGFGLAVVDAIRPITPLGIAAPDGFAIRQATPDDADQLAALDAHYVTITPSLRFLWHRPTRDPEGFRAFFSEPTNSVWLALAAVSR
jgi:hypothetical protein